MKSLFFIIAVTLISGAWDKYQSPRRPAEIEPVFKEFPINCSIRALEVIDEDRVWFAGSAGMFGWTVDGGDTWTIDSIRIEGQQLEFRAISVTDNAVFLLNVASPAYLLKSKNQGQSWDIVYQEDHPEVFYDSMKFWDNENGIAMGDPIGGCLSVIITNDGGNNWRKLDCSVLPKTSDGEAAFAASNSNIAIYKQHVWLASGGGKARIFHSPDLGKSWDVYDTPMIQGSTMTGIFTVDFYDQNQGIIFGGDWENQPLNTSNKAITNDSGVTWELISDGQEPGYRSCVQYVPNSDGNEILAVGIPGISYSDNGGQTWQHFDEEYLYTIRIASSAKVAWLAGRNKIARMEW